MYRDSDLKRAELAFLNAPFEEGGWEKAITALAEVTESSFAQLIGIGGPLRVPFNVMNDRPLDPWNHLDSAELYGPGNWRIGVSDAPMVLRHEQHYGQWRDQHGTGSYDDAVSDLDIPYGCQSSLLIDPAGLTGIALLRTRRDGPCDEQALSRFRWLSFHAERAIRVQLALGEEAAQSMLGGLGGRQEPTLLLDRSGQLCAMTDAAEALVDCGQVICLQGFALRLTNPAEDAAFGAALRRLLQADELDGPALHEMRAGRSAIHPGGQWRLIAARLPVAAHSIGFEPALAITLRPYP